MRPPWTPNWTDVSFDHRAASAAVAACRRVAATIDRGGEVAGSAVAHAVASWRGRYREEFDADVRQLQSHRAELAADLRSFADVVESAAAEARLEQRRREELREQWYEESRRMEARAAALRAARS